MASDESPTYQYSPLQEEGRVWLIELQPSPEIGDQVNCSLIHTTLYDCEVDTLNQYMALSYVWGDPKDTRTILVEGKKLDITSNLDSALRHIGNRTRSRRLWADAICINQQDFEEKGIQVQQMGQVYRTAQRTIIYLENATEDSNIVLSYLSRQLKEEFCNVTKDSSMLQPSMVEAYDLISRPWFNRVWIFQELLLSRDPWWQCGNLKAPWVVAAKYLQQYPMTSSTDENIQQAHQMFIDMHESRTEFLKRDVDSNQELDFPQVISNLFDYMVRRAGLGVTNPLDVVYAHLGIAVHALRDGGKLGIHIDYTKTPKQLFEETTAHFISALSETEFDLVVRFYSETNVDFD